MNCPKCKTGELAVVDSRPVKGNTIRRRRLCLSCGFRFTTYEYTGTSEMEKAAFKRGYDKALTKIKPLAREILAIQPDNTP